MVKTSRICDIDGSEGALPFVFEDLDKQQHDPASGRTEHPDITIDLGHKAALMLVRNLYNELAGVSPLHATKSLKQWFENNKSTALHGRRKGLSHPDLCQYCRKIAPERDHQCEAMPRNIFPELAKKE